MHYADERIEKKWFMERHHRPDEPFHEDVVAFRVVRARLARFDVECLKQEKRTRQYERRLDTQTHTHTSQLTLIGMGMARAPKPSLAADTRIWKSSSSCPAPNIFKPTFALLTGLLCWYLWGNEYGQDQRERRRRRRRRRRRQ